MNVSKMIVLGALDMLGEASGYDVLQELKRKMVDKWLDVNTGSIYYAIKKLVKTGEIEALRIERDGDYPEKTIYTITESGQALFDELQAEAFRGLFPQFYGFKLALKFNRRRTIDEIRQLADEALARIDKQLAAMDGYLSTLDAQSWQHEFDGFFIEHDRRLFLQERQWIVEAVEWAASAEFQHNQRTS